jgi:hypothetical protein
VKIISESLRERVESFDSKDAADSDLEVNIAIFDLEKPSDQVGANIN